MRLTDRGSDIVSDPKNRVLTGGDHLRNFLLSLLQGPLRHQSRVPVFQPARIRSIFMANLRGIYVNRFNCAALKGREKDES